MHAKLAFTRLTLTRLALASVLAVTLFAHGGTASAAWRAAHGDADNTGFARVTTAPAAFKNQVGFATVGVVAPGANPVTGPDGTVYIGALAGQLLALHPDGSAYWKHQLAGIHGRILASPVVGIDGAVYVVSSVRVRDHRGGETVMRDLSFLHKFLPAGEPVYTVPFPTQYASWPAYTSTGSTSAPPNIWRYEGAEVVMVPVRVNVPGGFSIHLVAFDAVDGRVLADRSISTRIFDVTGSSPITDAIGDFFSTLAECIIELGCGFSISVPGKFPPELLPMPGVAIWENSGGSPWIWLADGLRSTVALKFYREGADLQEIYRFDDRADRRSTAPVALDNVVAAIGTSDGRVKLERGTGSVSGLGNLSATPTRLPNGRLIVINQQARLAVIDGTSVSATLQLAGGTIAGVAGSCTHLFVATSDELVTLDAGTLARVATITWTDGGLHAPVIGPAGHVYGMTRWGLFVFGPPQSSARLPRAEIPRGLCAPVFEADPRAPFAPFAPGR